MLHRKFAVIKLWPELKAAEDECIARIRNTARSMGLTCLEVDSLARLIDPPHTQLTQDDIDFVLSLHFDTPKSYDIFSFVALWNPLRFYHEWGYRRCTRNLLTHDDFLSCSSPWADDQIRRSIAGDPTRDGPSINLYHSLSEPILPPSPGDRKLFYAGINWEKIRKTKGRHDDLLKALDKTGALRIYGPRLFQGVNVWEGYGSYVGPLPFDGVSVIHAIHKEGIALCLSSDAHRESGLMSSRLFESLAAGAVVVCDENPFARKFFGDSLLYVDTGVGAGEAAAQIQRHVEWIKAEPEQALELARRAQDIFRARFSLDHCIENIYNCLTTRKETLAKLYRPLNDGASVALYCLMPEFHPAVLERHISSCLAQQAVNIRPVLLIDRTDMDTFGNRILKRLAQTGLSISLEPVDFFQRLPGGHKKGRRRNGELIEEILFRDTECEFFCCVSPSEQLFSDHLSSLLAVLQRSCRAGVAVADMLLRHKSDGADRADLAEDIADLDAKQADLSSLYAQERRPLGFGRFLFRKSEISAPIRYALPYLDALPMHLLIGNTKAAASKRCTVMTDVQDSFTTRKLSESNLNQEREILIDFAPSVFRRSSQHEGEGSPVLALGRMSAKDKTDLAVALAHSVPFPPILSRIGFGVYRAWLKLHRKRKPPE